MGGVHRYDSRRGDERHHQLSVGRSDRELGAVTQPERYTVAKAVRCSWRLDRCIRAESPREHRGDEWGRRSVDG